MIPAILPKRGLDPWGSGEFGAPRGVRSHKGVDWLCYPGTRIGAPVGGTVTKLGYPYKDDLSYRYVEITDRYGRRWRLFYVFPDVEVGQVVNRGKIVGESQDISARYRDPKRAPMQNHVHLEVLQRDGEPINPEKL